MNRILFGTGLMILMAGCVSHYSQRHGDTLVLYLKKPGAEQVIFASSLDGFEPHKARKLDGKWVVFLPSNAEFRYYYVVDGQPVLPSCRMKEKDDFGSENCIFDPSFQVSPHLPQKKTVELDPSSR